MDNVAATYALEVYNLLDAWQLPAAEVLAACGLSAAELRRPGATLSWETMAELLRRAQREVGDEVLGYHIGIRARITVHGFLGFACMTSATLGESIETTIKFAQTRGPGIAVYLARDGETASITIREWLGDVGEARDVAIWGFMTAFWKAAEGITGRSLAGDAEMVVGAPSRSAMRRVDLPGQIRFGASCNRLIFPAHYLDLPLPRHAAAGRELALAKCVRAVEEMDERWRFLSTVRRELSYPTGAGFRTQTEVAEAMAVSASTLKRRLAEFDASFGEQLRTAQRSRALALLENAELTVTEIAHMMGFSDTASFVRAFKNWFEETPGRYRDARRIGLASAER